LIELVAQNDPAAIAAFAAGAASAITRNQASVICGRIAIGYYCSTLYILPLRGRALHLLGQQVCYVIPPLWASVVTGDTQWLEVVLVVVMLPALCGGLVGLAQEMIVLWLASRFAEMETHHRLEVERATKDAQATERTLHKERKAMVRNFKESLCNHRATEAMYASVLERLLKVQREVARERDVMRLQAAKHTNASPSSSPGSPRGSSHGLPPPSAPSWCVTMMR